MHKIVLSVYIYILLHFATSLNASNPEFNNWVKNFKKTAISSGVSEVVVEDVKSGVEFLPKVIQYDRFQPEFYEDTDTYIKKRKGVSSEENKKVKAWPAVKDLSPPGPPGKALAGPDMSKSRPFIKFRTFRVPN